MKKIFLFALAAACALTACQTGTTTDNQAAAEVATIGGSDIAYVSVEQVLAECELMLGEGQALAEKTQKAQESWAKKEQSLAAEAAQLQEKYEKGLITTRDAQAKQESIQKRVAAYQASAQKEAQTLDEENRVFTNRMQDLVMRAVQEVNAEKQYKMIVNANSLLDADTTLNITLKVLDKVNELYTKEKNEVK
ncbi:MAG: OmpH family outer membrane protein [Alistipes sp.]|nr:OmpH family outer membrane protein [Alistipes sp.]